jgi:FkbM family methyltransferase
LFFIQIGAHDGVTVDPIRRYVEEWRWSGIVVEPQPKMFAKLRAAYKHEPWVKLEQVAISRSDGEASLYAFKDGQNLPYHATMLASFFRNSLTNNGHGYKGEVEELKVPTLCVKSLLGKHMVKQVDLLQIDTEGYDRDIIDMFFEAGVYPTIIHFEDAIGDKQHNPMLARLNSLGYGIWHHYPDTLAYRAPGGEDFRKRVMGTQEDLNKLQPVF